MHLRQGTLLQNGKYRIVRFINSGGFGCTYEALHTVFDEKVAIKEFFVKDFCNRDENTSYVTVGTNSKKALVEKLKKKFIKEAKSIRKLHHNGIVKVSDVFEENGTAYYVMDYIEGRSLSQLIDNKGRLTETETMRYIRQVSETLKYVHSKNMLHLDIKPGNIMIGEEDNAILIDFGTSKQYDEESGENTSTLLGKTPGYAPPEQMANVVMKFTEATDIYALGATMYKMLTGITPPDSSLRSSGIVELESLPPEVDKDISAAIYKSLSLNKQHRPQSIDVFLEMLGDTPASDNHNYSHNSTFSHSSNSTANEETVVETSKIKNESEKKELHDVYEVNGVTFKMIAVEGGTFKMGATSEQGSDADSDERPVHSVTLSDYYIGETEVTQELWDAVMGTNPSRSKGSKKPVERVSWNDCQEFITKLNNLTGKNFRLPTEAEWEYAARGGNKSKGYKYSGSNTIGNVAWYTDNSGGETHDVKTKQANELGIYDMSGNVYEWCQDWYGSYSSGSQTNPTGPTSGSDRVNRGGSWDYIAEHCRVSFRFNSDPGYSGKYLGLRLSLSQD